MADSTNDLSPIIIRRGRDWERPVNSHASLKRNRKYKLVETRAGKIKKYRDKRIEIKVLCPPSDNQSIPSVTIF